MGCGWGWWFGRPERRQLRLCYLVVVQSWPGKMAAEMSKRSSQVAPGQLEGYGIEVGWEGSVGSVLEALDLGDWGRRRAELA